MASEPFRTRDYVTPEAMGAGLNEQASEGYHLSSWQIDPQNSITRSYAYGRFVCVFTFVGCTTKPTGLKCR